MSELHSHLREALLNFLWNQWDSFGAPAQGVGKPVSFVIDPEALLLASMRFGASESRMSDIITDWLPKNGALLNLQRLKNLQSNTKLGTRENLTALAGTMESAGLKNWKSLGDSSEKSNLGKSESRKMSQSPDPSRPENFLLKMRMFFGLSARPEVITWLLTHPSGHAAQIARETGWLSKSVQAILNDLEASGMLLSHMDGRKKIVSINPGNTFLNHEFTKGLRWLTQAPFYLGILHIIHTHERMEKNPHASASVKSILIHQNLTAINAAFRLAGSDNFFIKTAPLKGLEAVEEFAAGSRGLVVRLKTRNFP